MLRKILFMHSEIIVKDNIVQFDNLYRVCINWKSLVTIQKPLHLHNNSKYYRTTPARNIDVSRNYSPTYT